MQKVLIIEEDAPRIRLLAWALRQEHEYDVLAVKALRDAAKVAAVRPDVIVFNTEMPLEDKRKWIKALRDLVPDAGIIDLHPWTSEDEPVETGADAYLAPPYVDSLVSIIRRVGAKDVPADSP